MTVESGVERGKVLREAVRGWSVKSEFVKSMSGRLKELVASPEWDGGRAAVSITLDDRELHVWFAASGEVPGRQEDFSSTSHTLSRYG
jgi:hypothetical protein